MLRLEPCLRAIVEQEYPRFSDAEYARRHRALAAVMGKHDLDHLLVVTDHRTGNAPQWVTGWPGNVEAYVVFRPRERSEERRVGEEGRSRGAPYHLKKKKQTDVSRGEIDDARRNEKSPRRVSCAGP